MEASIHRRYRSIRCISSLKNPGHGGGFARHESLWSGASSARLKFEGVAQSVFSTEFSSRRVVCRSQNPFSGVRRPIHVRTRQRFPSFAFRKRSFWRMSGGKHVAPNDWQTQPLHLPVPPTRGASHPPSSCIRTSSHTRQPINYEHAIRRRVSKRRFAKRCCNISCNNERIVPFANSNFHSPQFLSFG